MPDDKAQKKTVFISDSSVDRDRTTPLRFIVEGLGHQVFPSDRSITPNEDWERALRAALDRTDILIVFWTKRAAESERSLSTPVIHSWELGPVNTI